MRLYIVALVTYAIYYHIVWSFYINLCKGSTKNSFYSCKKKSKRFVAVTAPLKPSGNRYKPPGKPAANRTEGEFEFKFKFDRLPTGYRQTGPVNRNWRPAV
jgi:hypothetical protein